MLQKSNHTRELIERRIKYLGITKSELGRRLGLKQKNQQQIFNIMNGRCQLPVKHVKTLSQNLEINETVIIDAMTRDYCETLIKTIGESQLKIQKTIGDSL